MVKVKKVPPQKLDATQKAVIEHLCRPLQDAADSLTNISDSLRDWVTLQQKRYEKEFPETRDPSPVTVGKARYASDEDIAPELRGELFPEIGPREKRAIAREERKARELSRNKKGRSR